MPRTMPPLDRILSGQIDHSLGLVEAGENLRVWGGPGSKVWAELSIARLEYLYELSYLRMFIAWEIFLEGTFFRYLCGYRSRYGQAVMKRGSYFPTLAGAELTVLSRWRFLHWYDPGKVIRRSQLHMRDGRHEQVVSSNRARLAYFAAIRHRVA